MTPSRRSLRHGLALAVTLAGCGRVGFDPSFHSTVADVGFSVASCAQPMVLRPTGDTTEVWDVDYPNGGPHYAKLDEVSPDDDASYIASAVDAVREEHTHPSIMLPPSATIPGITVFIRARVETTPLNSEAAPALTSMGTQIHADMPVTTSYADHGAMFSTDPHTGQPWTADGVNAMTFGVRKSYADTTARVTQVWAVVGCIGTPPFGVNAGGPMYIDQSRQLWNADTAFTGGGTQGTNAPIANTTDETLYQTERFGNVQYRFAVPDGSYMVTLKFAELFWTQPGQRVFDASIDGATVLSNFDIVAEAGGPNIALDRSFPVSVTDGQITVQLAAVVDQPKISAIWITPP